MDLEEQMMAIIKGKLGDELNPLQSKLVKLLSRNGPMTRNQMVDDLKRARTTIYDNLAVLICRDIVKRFPRQINYRGRPTVFFKLKDD